MPNLSFKNKKRLSLFFAATIMLFAVVSAIFCMHFSTAYITSSNENYSASQIFANDDFTGIRVAKSSLNKKSYADFMAENNIDEIYSTDKNIKLTTYNAEEELEKLGYTVYDKGDDYLIYTQFFLKRLMVSGDYSCSYDAVSVVKGMFYDTLSYESEQATANAYYSLVKENGVDVMLDALISVSDDDESDEVTYSTSHDYSSYKSWGAEAMDIQAYNEYLEATNIEKEVAVVVIDTGINTSHEMFKDRFFYDDDGNIVGEAICDSAYTYSGYAFEDDKGHGTHVSGIIASLTPQNVKIIPIKVISQTDGTVDYFYTALEKVINDYSKKYDIVAVNMSLSVDLTGYALVQFNSYYTAFYNYFANLRNENILPIVAAGNVQSDIGGNGTILNLGKLPAKCENAVVVSALAQTTTNGQTTYTFASNYSNYGSQVDFSAAGTNITSAYIASTNKAAKNAYGELSGTSMATPHVTAAIALLCIDKNYWKDGEPDYDADTIETTLRSYTVKLNGKDFDQYYGYGMVNFASIDPNEQTEVTITLSDQSGVYGDEINLDNTLYVINDKNTAVSGNNLVDNNNTEVTDDNNNSNGIELLLSTEATKSSSVGEYKLKATVAKAPAHLSITIKNAKYTVVKREIAIELQNQTGYYGDTPELDQSKYTVTEGSIVNGDEKDLTLYTLADGYTCGSFPIYYVLNNNNYIVKSPNDEIIDKDDNVLDDTTGDVTAYYTVQAREIEFELEAQFGYYNDEILLDQTFYSIKSGSLVNGDECNMLLTTNAKKGDDIGEYKITLVFDDENYDVSFNTCYYTILPKELTVVICDQQIEYSEEVDTSAFGYEIEGEDDLQISGISLYTTEKVYEIDKTYTIYGENSNKNYEITFICGKLSFILPDDGGEDDQLANDEIGNNNNENTDNTTGNSVGTADGNNKNDGDVTDNTESNAQNNAAGGSGNVQDEEQGVVNNDKNIAENPSKNDINTPENDVKTPENDTFSPNFTQDNNVNAGGTETGNGENNNGNSTGNSQNNNGSSGATNGQNNNGGTTGDSQINNGSSMGSSQNNNGSSDADGDQNSGKNDSTDGKDSNDDAADESGKENNKDKQSGSGNVFNIYINGTGCGSTTIDGGDCITLGLAFLLVLALIIIVSLSSKRKVK